MLASAAAFACVGIASAGAQEANFDVPAGEAGKSLPELARQAGVQIMAPGSELHGLVTPEVKGHMAFKAALRQMLAHTSLEVASEDGRIFVLRKAGAAPVEGAAPPANIAVENVIVTGSRGRERTVTSSPTPVDLVPGSEIATVGGQSSMFRALGALVPSFNAPPRTGGASASIIQTGGLRGLNPDQTLVLVNGKRRHRTSLINAVGNLYNGSVPVDLDMIPASAIDHVEVLRDGAAAQYGSDAIAGVINIILRSDAEGADMSFSGGQNIDRADGTFYAGLGHAAFNLGDKGFVNVSLSAKTQYQSNRAIAVDPSVNLYNLVNGARDPREATIDRLVTRNYGQFPVTTLGGEYDAQYEVSPGFELYSFGTVTNRNSLLNSTFQAPSSSNKVLPELYPNGFYPRNTYNEVDYEGVIGVRGTLGRWKWDLSSDYGGNIAHISALNTLNPSLGPTSPTRFDGGMLASSQWVNNLDVTGGYEIGEGHLQVSAGLEHRLEHFSENAGSPLMNLNGRYVIPAGQPNAGQFPAPGLVGSAGVDPTAAGHAARNNFAAYLDLAYDPSESLTIGVAGRVEHFDDSSGDTIVGKINARYALNSWLAIRGDINNGFRAPALAQEVYAATTPQQVAGAPGTILTIRALPVSSPSAIALGAKPLRPETSLNYSAGFVLTPTENFTATVDAYSIDVYGHIVPTGTLSGAAITTILTSNGLPPLSSATYFTNALNTRTQGFDLVATYTLDLSDWGAMHLGAAGNYNINTITHVIPNPPQLAALGPNFVIFDHAAVGNLTVGLPKTKIVLSDTWTWSDLSFTTRFTRYDHFIIQNANPALDRAYNAKWLTDLELSWQATPMFNFAVGGNNVFDVYPSRNGIFNPLLGSQQYGATPLSPFGFTGGFYYGRVTIKM